VIRLKPKVVRRLLRDDGRDRTKEIIDEVYAPVPVNAGAECKSPLPIICRLVVLEIHEYHHGTVRVVR